MLELAAVAHSRRQQHRHVVPALERQPVQQAAPGDQAEHGLRAGDGVVRQEDLAAAAFSHVLGVHVSFIFLSCGVVRRQG